MIYSCMYKQESGDAMKQEDCKCELDSCLFFSAAKLSRVFGKIADEAFAITGLSPNHALVLYIVNKQGTIHQKEIGEMLHLTPSTITRFIDKLEGKKLVVKSSEGKNAYISTTEKGQSMQELIITAWNSLHKTYDGILSEEETRQYVALSNKLMEKLEHYDD